MPIAMQKKLSAMGAKIEPYWSMWKIDNITIANIATEIKAVSAKNCILSSDSGQAYSKSPSAALKEFGDALLQEGITKNELITMLITNPKKLLGIRRKEVKTMIENMPIVEARRELSRRASALYPEWSSLLSDTDLERRLIQPFRRKRQRL